MIDSYIATGGGRVRARRHVLADAPRLVFATDGPNVLEHYDPLVEALRERADLTVFEPPGTGGSHAARGFSFTLDAFADTTADVLATLPGPVTLIAPCYFGYVGQRVAARMPAQVERLVLVQTPPWSDMMAWCDRVDRKRWVRRRGVGQLLVWARRRAIASGWYKASAGNAERAAQLAAISDRRLAAGGAFALVSLMQGLERAPFAPVAITQPTLLVWGARDRTHRGSDPAATGFPVASIDTAGHSPELEEPRAFADLVMAG